MFAAWMKFGWNAALLGFESQQVIAMRLASLAKGGPAASREAERMVSEKAAALSESAIKLSTGGSANSVLKDYRRKVRANKRRLARKLVSSR